MVKITIAGKINCPRFAHVSYVAKYLEKQLPHWELSIVTLLEDEWKEWILNMNRINDWRHTSSPIIYKELLHFKTSIPYLIGGICEFWEYCHDYYGVESTLSEEETEKLAADNVEERNEQIKARLAEKFDYRNIIICGNNKKCLDILLPELFKINGLQKKRGLNINFFEVAVPNSENEVLNGIIDEIQLMYPCKAKQIHKLQQALPHCDLMIIIDDDPNNQHMAFIKACYIADEIRNLAHRSLKVIFAYCEQACLSASIILDRTELDKHNVIAIVSDFGTGPLNYISRTYDIPLHKLSAPPVWGFDKDIIVDIESMIKRCTIRIPYHRATISSELSNLPSGTSIPEFRRMYMMLEDPKSIMEQIEADRMTILNSLNHNPIYSKVLAFVKVLGMWYDNKNKTPKEIISLGVASNGSFRIPENVVFAQPVTLEYGIWKPFDAFPVRDSLLKQIKLIGKEAEIAIVKSRYTHSVN